MTDPLAIDQYFTYRYIPAPDTIYANIEKLPPAYTMVCEPNKIEIRLNWDLEFQPSSGVTEQEYAKEVRYQVRKATAVRLESEARIGFFLGDCLSSNVVFAAAAESSFAPLETSSIGFDEKYYNELPY